MKRHIEIRLADKNAARLLGSWEKLTDREQHLTGLILRRAFQRMGPGAQEKFLERLRASPGPASRTLEGIIRKVPHRTCANAAKRA